MDVADRFSVIGWFVAPSDTSPKDGIADEAARATEVREEIGQGRIAVA